LRDEAISLFFRRVAGAVCETFLRQDAPNVDVGFACAYSNVAKVLKGESVANVSQLVGSRIPETLRDDIGCVACDECVERTEVGFDAAQRCDVACESAHLRGD